MSIHCLICGHQGHWRDDGEYNETPDTWRTLVIFKDKLTEKYGHLSKKERLCDIFYVHTDCLIKWLKEDCGADVTKKTKEGLDKIKRIKDAKTT
jgi:hypothetical protein